MVLHEAPTHELDLVPEASRDQLGVQRPVERVVLLQRDTP
jgi:hypothetical protein